jgi:hypothetical protein
MIVPSFIGAGGNGFIMMGNNRRNHRKGDKMDIEIVEKYLAKLSPVVYKNDGRLQVLT